MFSFLADFVIRYIKPNQRMPLILERPFMKTVRMPVDIDKGEVKVKIKDCEVYYKVIGICHPRKISLLCFTFYLTVGL